MGLRLLLVSLVLRNPDVLHRGGEADNLAAHDDRVPRRLPDAPLHDGGQHGDDGAPEGHPEHQRRPEGDDAADPVEHDDRRGQQHQQDAERHQLGGILQVGEGRVDGRGDVGVERVKGAAGGEDGVLARDLERRGGVEGVFVDEVDGLWGQEGAEDEVCN